MALNGAVALLVSVIFTGNTKLGGIERSWMHWGDMITMIIVAGVLAARVAETDAQWAQKNTLTDGFGMNCKTLLLLFLPLTLIKLLFYTDFIDPHWLLAEGSEMSAIADWMWKIIPVMILECFIGILYSVLYDDDNSHELMVFTILIMSVIAGFIINSEHHLMSNWTPIAICCGLESVSYSCYVQLQLQVGAVVVVQDTRLSEGAKVVR